MLTPELLPVRRKDGELCLTALVGKARKQYLELADQVLAIAHGSEGMTREQLQLELSAIGQTAQETRIVRGLAKLVEDATQFEEDRGRGAVERREALYERAARAWKDLSAEQRFDRAAVVAEAASQFSVTAAQFEAELFVDLPAAQRVLRPVRWSGEQLLQFYETARIAAVLLRAVRVVATFRIANVSDVRRLFRTLKFRQLLFEIAQLEDGRYEVVLSGPYSLFEAVTRYGLQLALCWSDLQSLDDLRLEADLRWGKSNERLSFKLEARSLGTAPAAEGEHGVVSTSPTQTDDVRELAVALRGLCSEGTVLDGEDVLELPGAGLCVPDLCYVAPDGRRIYLEVLGYWSRASVWQRVELVEKGLMQPVLFLVSSRLRVSEEVLDAEATSALYVYRGRINPARVWAKLKELLERPHSGALATTKPRRKTARAGKNRS